ncbi:hypothetical protein Taro_012985 [Colocasia esculenta]|uniref:Uncharacterized protein n=1 Tax=Colocasia esculenta TaxID=4460 RepID=A0A843UF56_COLES|nr:hypothetical protein [Colocasia esculenta]
MVSPGGHCTERGKRRVVAILRVLHEALEERVVHEVDVVFTWHLCSVVPGACPGTVCTTEVCVVFLDTLTPVFELYIRLRERRQWGSNLELGLESIKVTGMDLQGVLPAGVVLWHSSGCGSVVVPHGSRLVPPAVELVVLCELVLPRGMPQKMKARRFVNDLKPQYITQLAPPNIQTYAEMVKKAQLLEDATDFTDHIKGKFVTKELTPGMTSAKPNIGKKRPFSITEGPSQEKKPKVFIPNTPAKSNCKHCETEEDTYTQEDENDQE